MVLAFKLVWITFKKPLEVTAYLRLMTVLHFSVENTGVNLHVFGSTVLQTH